MTSDGYEVRKLYTGPPPAAQNEGSAVDDALRQFALWAISESSFQGGDLDGGDIQGKAVALGLLKEVQATEPCGDQCACAEFGFPQECYRFAELLAAQPKTEDTPG